jgi:hypothetical protein
MVFLLFVISIAVLEAILHADKNRERSQTPGPRNLQSRDLRAQDLRALSQALQNEAPADVKTEEPGLPSTEPVVAEKGYNRERGRTE